MCAEARFPFSYEDWRLFGNALNEVINGFAVPDFERTIGADKEQMSRLLKHLHTLNYSDVLELGVKETRNVRNALRETIRKLGIEEFHTRTGYDFEKGNAVLKKLDGLLASP